MIISHVCPWHHYQRNESLDLNKEQIHRSQIKKKNIANCLYSAFDNIDE